MKRAALILVMVFVMYSNATAKPSCNRELHHVFPGKYKNKFERVNIDINNYTVLVTTKWHDKHGRGRGGGAWGQEWVRFFNTNPKPTRKSIFRRLGKMCTTYNLANQVFYRYDPSAACNHKKRKESGKGKINKDGSVTDSEAKARKNKKNRNQKEDAQKGNADRKKLSPDKGRSKSNKSLLGKGGKILKKVARPVQVIITIYESGKMVESYYKTGEVDPEEVAKKSLAIAGGIAGAEAGAALGVVACAPAVVSGPGYLVCVGVFTVVGGVAGDVAGTEIAEFTIENKELLKSRIEDIQEIYKSFASSIIFEKDLKDDKYISRSRTKMLEAIRYFAEGNKGEAMSSMSDAYVYLAFTAYHKSVKYKNDIMGEVLEVMTGEGLDYAKLAAKFFNKSIDYGNQQGFTYYYLADSYLILKNYDSARRCFKKAQDVFYQEERPEWVQKSAARIKLIYQKM